MIELTFLYCDQARLAVGGGQAAGLAHYRTNSGARLPVPGCRGRNCRDKSHQDPINLQSNAGMKCSEKCLNFV
jgi:hypothetical protein